MKSQYQGGLTEAVVLTELKRRQIPVSIPFGDNERYDFVIDSGDGTLHRSQVETGCLSDAVVDFHSKSQHTNSQGNLYNHYDGDLDHFLV